MILQATDNITFRPVEAEVADPRRSEEQRTQHAGQQGVKFILSPPGAEEVLTVGVDNSVKRWEKSAAEGWRAVETVVPANKDEMTAAAYAGGAKVLLFATVDSHAEARIWRMTQPHGQAEAIAGPYPKARVLSLLTDAQADRFALLLFSQEGNETTGSLWSLTPVSEMNKFGKASSVSLSADGKQLAVGRSEGSVELFDTDNLKSARARLPETWILQSI